MLCTKGMALVASEGHVTFTSIPRTKTVTRTGLELSRMVKATFDLRI